MTDSVGIYTRISSDRTRQRTATTRQEEACRAFASLRGWRVEGVYEDVDVSAYQRSIRRPATRPCPPTSLAPVPAGTAPQEATEERRRQPRERRRREPRERNVALRFTG